MTKKKIVDQQTFGFSLFHILSEKKTIGVLKLFSIIQLEIY